MFSMLSKKISRRHYEMHMDCNTIYFGTISDIFSFKMKMYSNKV